MAKTTPPVLAALAALALGLAGWFLDLAWLGAAAGLCGVVAGGFALWSALGWQRATRDATRAHAELNAARMSFDEQVALAREEANSPPKRSSVPHRLKKILRTPRASTWCSTRRRGSSTNGSLP